MEVLVPEVYLNIPALRMEFALVAMLPGNTNDLFDKAIWARHDVCPAATFPVPTLRRLL